MIGVAMDVILSPQLSFLSIYCETSKATEVAYEKR